MIVGATGGHRPPRYAQGLAVAVLIVVGTVVWQGALTSPTSPPSSSPTVTAIAQASTSATPSSSGAARTVSPTSQLDPGAALVHKGPLDPGTHAYLDVDRQGFNLQFTVAAGWTWDGRYLSKGGVAGPGGAAIFFFGGPVHVYADPCHWAGAHSAPPTSQAADKVAAADKIAALVTQPSRSATTPVARPIGRWGGNSVELRVPNDLDLAACDGGQFRSWGPDSEARIHQGPGQHDLVWALDIEGGAVEDAQGTVIAGPVGGLIIDAASFPGTPADVMSEVDAILGSIYIGHWG